MHTRNCSRILALWLIITASAFSASAFSSGSSFSRAYDRYFEYYGTKYLTGEGYQWQQLKAQCAAESGPQLDRRAVSPAGAVGVCQFMAGTWSDVTRSLGRIGASRTSPRANIHAAAYYDRRLSRIWFMDRSTLERWDLTVASYNAGPGSILSAQRLSGGKRTWADIAPFLDSITGHHANETRGYVARIKRYTAELLSEE